MLWIHEVHRTWGKHEDEFEAIYRDEWMPAVARDGDAKLLYYAHLTHGSGRAYTVITVTAARDAAAWGSVDERVQRGDLKDVSRALDQLRHNVTGKILTPAYWSPVIPRDFDAVPVDPSHDHEPSLFMEDTVWPWDGMLLEYIDKAAEQYAPSIEDSNKAGTSVLEVQSFLHTAYGTGQRAEVVLWQRITNYDRLWNLFANDMPKEAKAPGTWMNDALVVRDDWRSRLLRTARWSPLF